jgi:cytochrome b561
MQERYDRVAMALHWAIALLALSQIGLGWWMIELPKSPPGLRAGGFNLHKSIGITLGLLMLVRVRRCGRGADGLRRQ